MQKTLPQSKSSFYYFYYKKKKRNPLKYFVFGGVVFLIAFISVCLSLINTSVENYKKEKIYYMLSVCETMDYTFAERMCKEIKEKKGIGYLLNQDGKFYVIAFVYKTKDSAVEVLSRIVQDYPKSEIMELKKEKLDRKACRLLKQKKVFGKALNASVEISEWIYDLSINQEKLNSRLYRDVEKRILQLENYCEELKEYEEMEELKTLTENIILSLTIKSACLQKIKDLNNSNKFHLLFDKIQHYL